MTTKTLCLNNTTTTMIKSVDYFWGIMPSDDVSMWSISFSVQTDLFKRYTWRRFS